MHLFPTSACQRTPDNPHAARNDADTTHLVPFVVAAASRTTAQCPRPIAHQRGADLAPEELDELHGERDL